MQGGELSRSKSAAVIARVPKITFPNAIDLEHVTSFLLPAAFLGLGLEDGNEHGVASPAADTEGIAENGSAAVQTVSPSLPPKHLIAAFYRSVFQLPRLEIAP
jgi:hypothetical protein